MQDLHMEVSGVLLGNTSEWFWCEQRIVALKNILVTLYDTSFWNRFANVATYEVINRLSREILLKAKEIVQGLGYELVYADTDSVFLKNGATFEELLCVKDILAVTVSPFLFLFILPLQLQWLS
jgi:DNA polymerase elongation subunit (family B)